MKKHFPAPIMEHRLGVPGASITVVEFFDFECPFCAAAEKPLRQVLEAFDGEVSLVVRHFPLLEEHQWASVAALASEAAANQGKFWEMHDLLFQHQDEFSVELFVDLAEELGLNEEVFLADLQSKEVQARVKKDMTDGESLGVDGTPTIYVNGELLEEKAA